MTLMSREIGHNGESLIILYIIVEEIWFKAVNNDETFEETLESNNIL